MLVLIHKTLQICENVWLRNKLMAALQICFLGSLVAKNI